MGRRGHFFPAGVGSKLNITGLISLSGASGDYIALGVSPAATGIIRIANNTAIKARNAANNADITIALVDAGNNIHLGTGGGGIFCDIPFTAGQGCTTNFLYNQSYRQMGVNSPAAGGGSHNASFTVDGNADVVTTAGLTGAITATLPASPVKGRRVILIDEDGTCGAANTITINGNGANIMGAATLVLNTAFAAVFLIFTGTRWNKVPN